MKYFMLLTTTCVDDITSCCSDYGIATYLHIIKEALNLIRFIVAAILIIMLAIDFAKMVINPVEKNNEKKISIRNKVLSAVIVFFVPTIVSVLLSTIPDSVSDIYGCWNSADEIFNTMQEKASSSSQTQKNTDGTVIKDNKDYSTKEYNRHYSDSSSSSNSSSSSSSNTSGQSVAAYAQEFVGNRYVYGGTWNGEKPYTPTDCSGFVQGIYKHFGISLPRTCTPQSQQGTAIETLSSAQPGDLIFYGDRSGISHVAMYIGNNQVVHASNSRDGVKISPANYRVPLAIRRYI